jgi:Ca-activated chloride channel family protein
VSFQTPLALVGLLVVPALIALYLWRDRGRRAFSARFGNPDLMPNVVDRAPGRRRHVPIAVLLVALGAMIVGVARPHATLTVKREEATVVLALDTSRSMKSTDVAPTRLGAARGAAEQFIEDVPEKFRIGVVGFASRAGVAVPPTDDRTLVREALASLEPGEGTALGDAIVLSTKLGQGQRSADGETTPPTSVLLISDGTQDGGSTTLEEAEQQARELAVPVYTVLVGTPTGTIEETLTGGYRRIIQVPTTPDALREIAQETGGEFFTATDPKELSVVYENLGSKLGEKRESRELTDVFAAGAVVLVLAGFALSALWFRRAA